MTTLIPKYDQGATGAINRPINLKLAEIISVKDFGAVGDGTTNDTVAIAAAVAAVPNNGTLYFPPGVYRGYIILHRDNISIIGAGAASTIIKLPDNCPNITVPAEGGGTLTGLPNVIEIGDCALGNSANPYTNIVIQNISVDGNKANNPDVTRDVFGHGIIATKTTYCKIIDVNASNCWVSGVLLAINSNFAFVRANAYNCGFSTTQPWFGFDVNSSKYGIFDIITDSCNYGARILDNCYANHLRLSSYNTSKIGFVYDNQTVNSSYSNNIEVNIYGGCAFNGMAIINNCFNSTIKANIQGTLGVGCSVIPSAAAYSSTGNNITISSTKCLQNSLTTNQYDSFNTYTINAVGNCSSGGIGDLHDADIYSSNCTFSVNMKGLPVPNGRAFIFRPLATNNYLASFIIDSATFVSSLDNQNVTNILNYGTAFATSPSANILTLPKYGNTVKVTGTASIANLNSPVSNIGRQITLIFESSLTVVSASGNLRLAGGSNFSATALDTLTLVSDGTYWLEVCRSAN